jgi:4,5-DOPA dioxygenase extradiol
MDNINDLHKISGTFSNTEMMLVFFLGPGSPMNRIYLITGQDGS